MNDSFVLSQSHLYNSQVNNPNSSIITNNCNFSNSNISNFSVLYQNIRSCRENFDKLIVNLASFNQLPSIIFLTEIWIYDHELDFYKIPEYNSVGCCNNNYRAGGVCAFYDCHLNCEYESISLNSADIIKLSVIINNVKYIFVCVYRFQFISVTNFVSEFTVFISKFKNQNIIIAGDMNIDILDFPPQSDEYIFMLSSFGFQSLINSPTRITSTTATCIDHCFARVSNISDFNASLHNLHISDHHLLKLDIAISSKVPLSNTLNWNKFDKIKFVTKILAYDFSPWLFIKDPELILANISQTFNRISESCCINVNKHSSKVKLKPWISDNLLRLMDKKKKIGRKCRKHPDNVDLSKYFIKLCGKVNDNIVSDKHNYYSFKFNSCNGDSKRTWSLVNDILGNRPVHGITKITSIDSVTLSDSKDIADEFGKYFSQIIQHLRASLNVSSSYNCGVFDNVRESFFIHPVVDSEVFSIINNLKRSSSYDVLGFNSNIIKLSADCITPILVNFINQCFSFGVIPDSLKIAIVVPIFKKGAKDIMDNYRPIALQPTILKIMEKVMKSRMETFLAKHRILNNDQHGFTTGKSTESALINFLSDVHINLNNKKCVAAVFIDIKRAFDMVDHELLLLKLQSIGFRGVSLNWFSSYLNNRRFMVKVGTSYSVPFKIEYGVPQGSVLGPLLFLIYINSLFSLNLKGKITAFADDVALTYCDSSSSAVTSNINSDMRVLRLWFDAHSMLLSEKSKVMFFKMLGNPYRSYMPQIFYHTVNCDSINCSSTCSTIEPVISYKYLGLNLDANLNWKIHCQKIKEQLNCALRAIYLLRKSCPSEVLQNFYYSCVESRLSYGLPCWGGIYMNTLEPLYILQKYILRVMFFKSRRDHTWPIFVERKILPVQHLYIFRVLKLFYSRSGQRLLRLINCYNVRNNYRNLFTIPRFSTELFRKFYLVSAPTFFNRLPLYLRLMLTTNKFLSSVKVWLLNNRDVEFMFAK